MADANDILLEIARMKLSIAGEFDEFLKKFEDFKKDFDKKLVKLATDIDNWEAFNNDND